MSTWRWWGRRGGAVCGAVRGQRGRRASRCCRRCRSRRRPATGRKAGSRRCSPTDDSFELHLSDTERAGRGAVRGSAAEALVSEAPERVRDLERLGFHFDADRHGRLALGLEGGHSVRRIVHAGGSATGRRLLRELSALVVGHPRVRVIEGARVSRLADARTGAAQASFATPAEIRTIRRALGRIVTARGLRAEHRRRRRAVGAHDQPARLDRPRAAARARRRSDPGGPRVRAVPSRPR